MGLLGTIAARIDVADVGVLVTGVEGADGPRGPGTYVALQEETAPFGADVRSVAVTNSLGQAAGTFEIELAPRHAGGGWETRIAPRSLVCLAFHRAGTDEGCTRDPDVMMLGLVDQVRLLAEYGQPQVQRRVRVSGRTLSCVLEDAQWFFHHVLSTVGVVDIPPDFRPYYAAPVERPMLRDETQLRTVGMFAVSPDLYRDLQDRHPAAAMEVTFKVFVGAAGRPAFIMMRFDDGITLAERLLFDAEAARRNWFDPHCVLQVRDLPTTFNGMTCWQVLQHFAEAPFLELFTESYGRNITDARVEVHCRKPPWRGMIGYGMEGASVQLEAGRPADLMFGLGAGETGFDGRFGDWDIEAETVRVTGDEIIAEPVLTRGIDGGAFNAYTVLALLDEPQAGGPAGQPYSRIVPPLIDEDMTSPSNVLLWGIRPLTLHTKYIQVDPSVGVRNHYRQILAYQLLLREWFYRLPALWRGILVVRGRTDLRVGKRLLDVGRGREYYITGVSHRMDFGGQAQYVTTVQVARGRDL